MMNSQFNYDTAFSRNIGWVTESEQALLKTKHVAIAGLGGVGGAHLLTLARLGVGKFTVSDFDKFGVENFNRQAGARLETVGKPKLDTLVQMAKQINPGIVINTFPEGVNDDNLSDFLKDADIYVDGLDFFTLDIREAVFEYCHRNNIPAVTAAPLGMGTAVINFMPGKMSFADYFGLKDSEGVDKYLKFFIGLSPSRLAQPYLVDPARTNLKDKKGPSTIIGCELCAGAAAAQTLKILLSRGKVYPAPHSLHFDPYRNKFKRCWRPWGYRNPLQKLSFLIGKKFLAKQQHIEYMEEIPLTTYAEKVIDIAKWAPSGDNTQPWSFKLTSDNSFTIIGTDTRDWVVYDLEGHASQMAIGALLESVDLAAKALSLSAEITEQLTSTEAAPTFDVHLNLEATTNEDKLDLTLAEHLKIRTVQRKPMPLRKIPTSTWEFLESALPAGFYLQRIESDSDRWNIAKLNFRNAKTRLIIPEGYKVHSHIIDWGKQFSEDKIPDQALGMNPIVLKIMPWFMKSWERVQFFNRYLLGSLAPRIELDLVPGYFCSAHVIIYSDKSLQSYQEYISAGKSMQRFWLACSAKGLSLQPEMTPLIFADYVRKNITFTSEPKANDISKNCAKTFEEACSSPPEQAFFMCRIGYGPLAQSRSTRKKSTLLLKK